MKKSKKFFLLSLILILTGIFIWNRFLDRDLYAAPGYRQLAEYWSPYIYQSTESRYDLITNFNFDNNWDGYDNWEHVECWPLRAYVYYSVIETTGPYNWYIITYCLFHPKDPGNPEWSWFWPDAHENDFEGCRVIIKKDGSYWGKLYFLETIAHTKNFTYYPDKSPYITKLVNSSGVHPCIYITPHKHAIYGENFAWAYSVWGEHPDCDYLCDNCRIFPSCKVTGIEYYYGGTPGEPNYSSLNGKVSYELINLENTIWAKRFGDPHRICAEFTTGGGSPYNVKFGAKFGGNNHQAKSSPCAVPPPWNYEFDNTIANDYGRWFIDPLRYYTETVFCHLWCAGERYLYNPFLYSSSGCPPGCSRTVVLAGLRVSKSANKYKIKKGESVTYKYEVYNKGIYPARNIKLTDNQFGLIGNNSRLAPHRTWTIKKTVTLNQTTTNQATVTSTYYYYCQTHHFTNKSNKVTVTVEDTPPPPPPPEPPKPPKPPLPRAEVVWSWDRIYSFTENEHSLAKCLKGKALNAHIDEDGNIEINIEPNIFPNILSSPDLEQLIPGKRFDAVRILYSNSIEYPKGRAKGRIGWLDETMVDKKGRLKHVPKGGTFKDFSLERRADFSWALIKLKDHPNWKKDVQTLLLNFDFVSDDPSAQGKFLIWRIDLIKIH